MYSDVFCKVYNEFGWNYYPEIFGEQLLLWLKQKDLQPKTALDMACGTGILCKILQESGIRAKNRKQIVDSLAAELILQGYMDRMKNT